MNLSALLTSVGINLALCVLLFALYSVLRKQPRNGRIYAARWVAEGKAQRRPDEHFNIQSLLPSTSWIRRAWSVSEEELLDSAGLDAVVFNRIFTFSLRVFSVAAIIGICVIVPVNYLGEQNIDFSELPGTDLESFSISNVNYGSNKLWVHFSAAYLITAFVCYLLYNELKYISSKRLAYFNASRPSPQHFTILVRSIPLKDGRTCREVVDNFFMEYHRSTYLSNAVVRRHNKLRELIEVPVAFVSFKSRYDAATTLRMQQSDNPVDWVTEEVPEPRDVYWPFFSTSYITRWLSQLIVLVASVILTVIFIIPVSFVSGLSELDRLETLLPFLKNILEITVVSQVVTGYLPGLLLQLLLSLIPPTMKLFSTMQGYIANSQIDRSACGKVLLFDIWNIFFVIIMSGSLAYEFKTLFDPKHIPVVLAVTVPAQATFFITYAVTSWTSLATELTQTWPLVSNLIGRQCLGWMSDDFEAPSIQYHSEIPRILVFGLLGLVYFLLMPLILPFILIYFCIGYIVYRNQLINVYVPKYDGGGRYWPIVHNSIIFSLILMQLIVLGIFIVRSVPLAAGLMVPLPVVTFVFNAYCRKRFLPMFQSYSAETLIKKDRDDEKNPAMDDFFSKLATAYRNPALDEDEHTTPLVSSSEP